MKWRLREDIKNFVWQKLWSHSMTQRHQSLSAFSIVTDAIFFHLVRCLYTSSFLLFWSHEMRIKVCVEELCECSRSSRDLSREKKVLWEERRRRKRREPYYSVCFLMIIMRRLPNQIRKVLLCIFLFLLTKIRFPSLMLCYSMITKTRKRSQEKQTSKGKRFSRSYSSLGWEEEKMEMGNKMRDRESKEVPFEASRTSGSKHSVVSTVYSLSS